MLTAILITNIIIILMAGLLMAMKARSMALVIAIHKETMRKLDTISGQVSFVDDKIPQREIRERREF